VDSTLNDCEIRCSLRSAARGAAARPRQSRRERPRVRRELRIFYELFYFFPSFLLDVYTFLFIIKNLTVIISPRADFSWGRHFNVTPAGRRDYKVAAPAHRCIVAAVAAAAAAIAADTRARTVGWSVNCCYTPLQRQTHACDGITVTAA